MAIEKPYGITNIHATVPLILDLDCHNYDAWRELFYTHYAGYVFTDHLTSPTKKPNDLDDVKWYRIDYISKSWIYGTLS